jgi:hypothetical protein
LPYHSSLFQFAETFLCKQAFDFENKILEMEGLGKEVGVWPVGFLILVAALKCCRLNWVLTLKTTQGYNVCIIAQFYFFPFCRESGNHAAAQFREKHGTDGYRWIRNMGDGSTIRPCAAVRAACRA